MSELVTLIHAIIQVPTQKSALTLLQNDEACVALDLLQCVSYNQITWLMYINSFLFAGNRPQRCVSGRLWGVKDTQEAIFEFQSTAIIYLAI